MNHARKSLAGLFALSAAFAMPMAFAQNAAASPAQPMQDSTAQSTPPASPLAQQTPPTTQADAAAPARHATWAEMDGDQDGKLSKAEAAGSPGLSKVFDQADADRDGALTAEEYKTFAAKNGASGKAGKGAKQGRSSH